MELVVHNIMKHKGARLLVLLILFGLAFFVRFQDISYRSIWMDEDRQAMYSSIGIFDSRIPELAGRQQQPLLDYYWEALWLKLLGLNERGIRMGAVVMGAAASVVFLLFLYRFYGVISAVIGYCLFAFNPWLLRYSVEARPYSLGIFFMVLFLYFYHRFIHDKRLSVFFGFAAVQVLFLCSVGFQPVVAVACFGAVSIFFSLVFNRKPSFPMIVYAASVYILAFIVAYPFLAIVRNASAGRCYFFNEMPARLLGVPGDYSLSAYYGFFDFIGEYRIMLGVCAAALAIGCFLRKNDATQRAPVAMRLHLLSGFILFPVFSWLLWYLAVKNCGLFERYKLVYLPVVLSVVAVGLQDILWLLKEKIKHRRLRVVVVSVFWILIIVIVGSIVTTGPGKARSLVTPPEGSWRDFYSVMSRSVKPGD